MNRAKLDKLYDQLLQGLDIESLSPGDQLSIAKSLITMVKFISTKGLGDVWAARLSLAESILEEAVTSLNNVLDYTPAEELPPGFTSRVFALNQAVLMASESLNQSAKPEKTIEDLAFRIQKMGTQSSLN